MSKNLKNAKGHVRLDVTKEQLVVLQDALDDYAGDCLGHQKGADAARTRALQRKLHNLTGEEMPPTQAARRASLRRLVKSLPAPKQTVIRQFVREAVRAHQLEEGA